MFDCNSILFTLLILYFTPLYSITDTLGLYTDTLHSQKYSISNNESKSCSFPPWQYCDQFDILAEICYILRGNTNVMMHCPTWWTMWIQRVIRKFFQSKSRCVRIIYWRRCIISMKNSWKTDGEFHVNSVELSASYAWWGSTSTSSKTKV